MDGDEEGREAEEGGVAYVRADARPSVDTFFRSWGAQSCVINGIEVRSITHDRCTQILMTGSTASGGNDWATVLAAKGPETILPHLVTSGPAYTADYTEFVIRLGENAQLSTLLDGSAMGESDLPVFPHPEDAAALEDAFVQARVARAAKAASQGQPARFMEAYTRSYDQLAQIREVADELDLGQGREQGDYVTLFKRLEPALSCLSAGYSRCAIAEHNGLWDGGWDTHMNIQDQSEHYEDLFENLVQLMEALETTPGPAGGSLLDETVVVVCSEMGRSPTVNNQGGKDHWTFTSAMLVGAGVRGGQVIGAYDDDLMGRPISLATGQLDDKGVGVTSSHLGATLLALGGLDPALAGESPIEAALG